MAAKLDRATEDHAIKLYLAGEPVEKIKADCGVSATLLQRIRERRGIPTRPRVAVPGEAIVSAYESGASEYGLSRQYDVSRGTIARILRDAGVARRDMSEAGKVRNEHLSVAERKRQTAAANRSARMRRTPEIDKFRHALQVEQRGDHDSPGEAHLAELLNQRGVNTAAQRAIGVYNVDLAALPVAVEVLGGGWHSIKTVHTERTPYILDEGWHLVMVWDYEGRSALGPGAADYLVAFLEEIRRNPPATCQYRVIAGQGELLAARGREDNEFPLEPPPRGGF